jgi:hypothetical protein
MYTCMHIHNTCNVTSVCAMVWNLTPNRHKKNMFFNENFTLVPLNKGVSVIGQRPNNMSSVEHTTAGIIFLLANLKMSFMYESF